MQITKVIDVTKSFTIVDPNAFSENLEFTSREDSPQTPPPILGFEGYNFMPTSYGYRSFFGTNGKLDLGSLPSRCSKILLYQFGNFQNILIALCEKGIFVSTADSSTLAWSWYNPATGLLEVPTGGTVYTLNTNMWTYAVFEGSLLFYRSGESSVFYITPTDVNLGTGVVTIHAATPTFLNMAGQMGIFRANGRLGFWDSANSISWSSLFAPSDFIPSVETLAGNAIFNGVLGRIVKILPQGTGFVIYATKSIVGVRYQENGAMIWDATTITDNVGIVYDSMVTLGATDLEHFAFTTGGIKQIGAFNALNKAHAFTDIIPDVYDLLKESRSPVYLQMMGGRFLCINLVDASYINGKTSFIYNTVDALLIRVLENDGQWSGLNLPPVIVETITAGISSWSTVESSIASQLLGGVTEGMYLCWSGSGQCMVPSRTTAIKPYNQDGNSVHISNTNLDLTGQISQLQAQGLVSTGVYTDPSPTTYPFNLDLGWTFPGINNVGPSYKGTPSGYLSAFISTQVLEWANYATIQSANTAAINATTPETGGIIQTLGPYYGNAAADAALQALLAIPPTTTLVGSYMTGGGTTAPGVFSGVGTNYATYSLTRTLSGGMDIVRTTTKNYSKRAVAPVPGYRFTGGWSWSNYSPTQGPINIISEALTRADLTPLVSALTTALLPATVYTPDSGGITFSNPVIYNFTGTVESPFDMTVDMFRTYHYGTASSGGTAYAYWQIGGTITALDITPYYIDVTETKSLSTVVNPALSGTSTLTASQRNVTWGYIPLGTNPPTSLGNYIYLDGAITVPGTGISGATVLPADATITYPGATFLLQDGSPAPLYPTFAGSLVLDTALKKWGKLKANFKQLLDLSPINAPTDGIISYTNFGIDMAMLNAAGDIYTFDVKPSDSWIRYGKLGYNRLGVTQMQEVRVHFRTASTGDVVLESSMDGRALELSLVQTYPFTNAANATVYGDQTGRWHTIKVSGNYDLHYLEFRGNINGRR